MFNTSTKMLLAVVFVALVTTSLADVSCGPGFVQSQMNESQCVCGDWPNKMVTCNNCTQTASMKIGYCMTYHDGEVQAGRCLQSFLRNDSSKLYYPLPTNLSDLNDRMCGPMNSKGLLCGECQDGFAVSPLHWHLCINCTGASNGWIKYIAAKYLPLTVIFMVIIIFSISIVSGPINSFIFFAQITVLAIDRQSFGGVYYRITDSIPIDLIFTLYDAWNLNISGIIPAFCLKNHLTRLQVMILEYVVAFYPIILAILLYIGIKLYDQNFRPVVYCWKPFLKCFLRFRRSVHPKTSMIDAFATFILLSYVRVFFIGGLFILPQPLYNSHGKKNSTLVLSTSTTTLFFHSKEHFPLAILSISVSLTFIAVPPIVLLFYQVSCFQKCLARCRMNTPTLHTFVEAFQGCYKDGTHGTRDCRYFAGLYFILRIVAIILIFVDLLNEPVLLFGFATVLFALVQPYKRYIYNVVDTVIFGLMGTVYFLSMCNMENVQSIGHLYIPLLVFTYVLYTFPLVCFVLFIVCLVLDRKTSYIQKLKNHRLLRCFFQDHKELRRDTFVVSATAGHWPDRLLNPEEYVELSDGNHFDGLVQERNSGSTYRSM